MSDPFLNQVLALSGIPPEDSPYMSPAIAAPTPTPPGNPVAQLATLMQSSSPEIDALRQERKDLIQSAYGQKSASGQQRLAQMLAAAIPAAIGAIDRGSKGAGFGARGGIDAFKYAENTIQEDLKRDREQDLAEAALLGDDIKDEKEDLRAKQAMGMKALDWQRERAKLEEQRAYDKNKELIDPALPEKLSVIRETGDPEVVAEAMEKATTKHERKLIQDAINYNQRDREDQADKKARETKAKDKKAADFAERRAAVPTGHVLFDPRKRVQMREQNLNEFLDGLRQSAQAANDLQGLLDTLDNGRIEPTSEDTLRAAQLMAKLITQNKKINKFGAHFTLFEQMLSRAEIGAIVSGESLSSLILDKVRGDLQGGNYKKTLKSYREGLMDAYIDGAKRANLAPDPIYLKRHRPVLYKAIIGMPNAKERLRRQGRIVRGFYSELGAEPPHGWESVVSDKEQRRRQEALVNAIMKNAESR